MKRSLFLLIAFAVAISATAQQKPDSTKMAPPLLRNYLTDAELPRWVIDINLLGGLLNQDLTTAASAGNYLNGVNVDQGNLSFKNGSTFGFDAQVGYFFGHSGHWGIGTGFMYLAQSGDAVLDNYHAEFQATDSKGYIYRQVVSPDEQIKESLQITNMNIPLLLKYKTRFSKNWGFSADAGLLFNIQEKNTATTNASFEYGAIYKYSNPVSGTDGGATIYETAQTPASGDFLITKSAYLGYHPNGDVNTFFADQRSLGANVGLGVKPTNSKNDVSYTTGSVGFMLRPTMSFYISDNVALNLGLYYIYQSFNNNAVSGYRLTNGMGDYSSSLNNVTKSVNQTYGLSLGVRFLFGKKHLPPVITSEDSYNPTVCGMCDGMLILHGLKPGKTATVNYNVNGTPAPAFTATVETNGYLKMQHLCAGEYTAITATVNKERGTAVGIPMTLVAPAVTISSQTATDASANGACDGSINLNGLQPGQRATVNYMMNGQARPAYVAPVPGSGRITLRGLCAGSYSGITVAIGTCTAAGTDVTIGEPAPPPPPPLPAIVDIYDNPIYFEVNKTIIHSNSMPIMEAAAKRLNEEKKTYIVVNGYTDITGSVKYNKALSIRRANAVKEYLVKMGVSKKRIKIVGHGPNDPAETNDTPEGRLHNRRAVMQLNVVDVQ